MTLIDLPDPSLVVLIGAAGSGKSTFAARHFAPTEVLSSDAFRTTIAGDPTDQSVNGAAFKALHASLTRRLQAGRLTVIDATNLTAPARRALLVRAAAAGVPVSAIVLDLPPELVLARNAARLDRVVPEDVVRRHLDQVRRLVDDRLLEREGYRGVVVLRDPGEVETLGIRRVAAV